LDSCSIALNASAPISFVSLQNMPRILGNLIKRIKLCAQLPMNTIDQGAGEFPRTPLTPISELAKDSMNEQKQFEKTASPEAIEAIETYRMASKPISELSKETEHDGLVDESEHCLNSYDFKASQKVDGVPLKPTYQRFKRQ
jgi:hypothetical protein